jgi:multidrug efflux pump
LILFRMPFGIIMTGVGIISLAGVVVNNAIVLIDYIDLLRTRDGLGRREAIIQACRTRFRPVVLTAVTTILGLIPLAIGFNVDFFGMYTSLTRTSTGAASRRRGGGPWPLRSLPG